MCTEEVAAESTRDALSIVANAYQVVSSEAEPLSETNDGDSGLPPARKPRALITTTAMPPHQLLLLGAVLANHVGFNAP
jgi:hypothetical protein